MAEALLGVDPRRFVTSYCKPDQELAMPIGVETPRRFTPSLQPVQRRVEQRHLVPGVPVPRVVAGGAVHARPRHQEHGYAGHGAGQRFGHQAARPGRVLVELAHLVHHDAAAGEAVGHAGRVARDVHDGGARRPLRCAAGYGVAQALAAGAGVDPEPVRQRPAPGFGRGGAAHQPVAGEGVGGKAGRRQRPRPRAGLGTPGAARGGERQQQRQQCRRRLGGRRPGAARHGHGGPVLQGKATMWERHRRRAAGGAEYACVI
jgi:hypothetical protein